MALDTAGARTATGVVSELSGEHVGRACDEPCGSVGMRARSATACERCPPAYAPERAFPSGTKAYLLKRARDRIEPVDAWSALTGALRR